ncbi:MAG: AraC family transcriptional regulator [Proteobacteria bacterium]|nr:AraC family transcriptional regulator [Pseudomonadota bacterium]
MQGLVFGWRTALLSVAVAQLLILAAAIARAPANRAANRTLALLLVVLAGVLTPWMIGFAGFYDRWRWLTFAPFSITLAVGPLLWLYLRALVDGRLPRFAGWHLGPPAVQFAYLGAGFLLPEPAKDRWAAASSGLSAGFEVAAAASLGLYAIASLKALQRYRHRLADHRSDDARYAVTWLGRAMTATLVLLPVWTVYVAWDAIQPLGYFNLMGLYLTIAAFSLYIGVEGWRHADLVSPRLEEVSKSPAPGRDWARLGEAWAAQVRAAGWATDPELSLATLASRLGTNTGYLSRALNEGLGLNFSAFVNGLRAEQVADRLVAGDGRDLLDIALDAGFASKASFNRAFRARFDSSPSAFRRQVSDAENLSLAGETEARPSALPVTPGA